jgi:hypothetical protein
MIDASDPPAPPDRIAPQFSVRELLVLTVTVAILLTIGVLSRGSRYFGALWSLWALAALVPIVAVWLVGRWRFVSAHLLAHGSMVLYLVSLGVPALMLGGDLMFGYLAWFLSFAGIEPLFDDWRLHAVGETMWYPIACTMGAAANVAFLTAYVAYLLSGRWPQAYTRGYRAENFGTAFALLVLLPLALSSELNAIYPGYGLWTASFLALALGPRHVA